MIKDITEKPCVRKYIRDCRDGSKEAYLHFTDGMEVWKYFPKLHGWKLMRIVVGEKEVY